MMKFDDCEDDFFDANELIDASVDCSPSEDDFVENENIELKRYGYDLWSKELTSIEERRKKFLGEMGLHELMRSPSHFSAVSDLSEKEMSLDLIMRSSDAELDGLSLPDVGELENYVCHTRDLDNGIKFTVHDIEQDGTSGVLNEIGSDKSITLEEFDKLIGPGHSVANFLKRREFCRGGKSSSCLKKKETKLLRWWRSFKQQTNAKSLKNETSSQIPRLMKIKIQKQNKRCKEVTALYMGQEIKAHKGLIRTMKFSPCGRYLASGGEDCVVLIWRIREVETCCSCFFEEPSTKLFCDVQDMKLRDSTRCHSTPILIPKKFFKIDDTPLQVLLGHTSDILDLSWSNSDMLLTSSKDKTVRMWKVGHNGCLKVFQHSDFVTCVQFNPVDSRYFISGSIDGKVRIWRISDSRVADWVDIRDIVTSLSHCPDGKGFIVGSISGNCRYYDYSVNSLQLSMQLFVRVKRKSSAKRITGLQSFREDSTRIIVSSADSRIQIFDGTDVVVKLKGHRRVKSQYSASLSSDEKHVISVGDDSHVYIWNYHESSQTSSRGANSFHPCESFLSENASIAVSWSGMNPKREVSGDHSNLVLPSPNNCFEPLTRPRDPDYISGGGWLFSGAPSRLSATWPEENLPSTTEFPLRAETCDKFHHHNHRQYYPGLTSVTLTWSRAILTGGIDGTIKTFHYYGFPIRL